MNRSIILAAALALSATAAQAADLGNQSGCCADLEERIAELEATVARKGNKRVTVQVFGQVNRALAYFDDGVSTNTDIIDNSASPSTLGVRGQAKAIGEFSVGYVLELGLGAEHPDAFGLGRNDNELYVRQSYAYVDGGRIGRVSIGLLSSATDGISQMTPANTAVIAPMLSVKPLTVDDSTEIFDGTRSNLIRYDTGVFGGFSASVAYLSEADNGFDIAARYAAEVSGLRISAGIGYRQEDNAVLLYVLPLQDVRTLALSGGVVHLASGVFASAAYGQVKLGGVSGKADAWHLQGGIERKFIEIGATTFYGEYLSGEVTGFGDADFWGLGVVQSLETAATDIYLGYRDSNDVDARSLIGGLRIKF